MPELTIIDNLELGKEEDPETISGEFADRLVGMVRANWSYQHSQEPVFEDVDLALFHTRITPESVRSNLRSGMLAYYLEEEDIVATLMMSENEGREMEIYTVNVHHSMRGRGLGRDLMDRALDRVRKLRRHRSVVVLEALNWPSTIAVYKKLGFKRIDRPSYWDGSVSRQITIPMRYNFSENES